MSRMNYWGDSYYRFIKERIESCKLECQVESAYNWLIDLHKKEIISPENYRDLYKQAICKEESLIMQRALRDFVAPHIKKRAEELAREERLAKIRLVKNLISEEEPIKFEAQM